MTQFPNRGRCTHCFSLFDTFWVYVLPQKIDQHIFIPCWHWEIYPRGNILFGTATSLNYRARLKINLLAWCEKWLFDKTFFASEVGIRQFVCQDVSCDKTPQLVLVESQWILVSIWSFPKMGATWLVDFMENPNLDQWMMTGGSLMTKRKFPYISHMSTSRWSPGVTSRRWGELPWHLAAGNGGFLKDRQLFCGGKICRILHPSGNICIAEHMAIFLVVSFFLTCGQNLRPFDTWS